MKTRISAVIAGTLLAAACGGSTTLTDTGTSASAATAVDGAGGGGGGGGGAGTCEAARTAADTCVQDALAACPDAASALKTCIGASRPADRDGDDGAGGAGELGRHLLPPPGALPPGFPCKDEIEAVRICLSGCEAALNAVRDACPHRGCGGGHHHGPHGGHRH